MYPTRTEGSGGRADCRNGFGDEDCDQAVYVLLRGAHKIRSKILVTKLVVDKE